VVRELQDGIEAEKQALARTLHDELGGLLVAAKMDVVWLRRRLDQGDPETASRWARVIACLEQGMQFKRRIVETLRPTLLDNLGLVAALGWLVEETLAGKGIECAESYPEEPSPLDEAAGIALFRVAQRTLRRIAGRIGERTELDADAARVTVALRENPEGVELEISGYGLQPADPSEASSALEIVALRQRVLPLGGNLTVTPLASTLTVRAAVPWAARRPAG
jgi:signal transduction histidine kinase